MTPYFFRGSILITDKILSYNEFMQMPVKDFERIEAMVRFKTHKIKQGIKKKETDKVKHQLSGLAVVDARSLGFSEEQLRIFKDGNN